MIQDVIYGVIASLVASAVVGLLSSLLFGKTVSVSTGICTKLYSLFLAFSTFILTMIFALTTNNTLLTRLLEMSDEDIFTIFRYSTYFMVLIFICISVVTISMLFAIFIFRQQEKGMINLNKKRDEPSKSKQTQVSDTAIDEYSDIEDVE